MAITSIGYDGTVDETQFERIIGYSASSKFGVNGAYAFQARTVAGQVLQVSISSYSGTAGAWTAGVVDLMGEDETVQLESPSSGTRWDLIVLRRDYQPPGGTTSLEVIKGSSRKAIPAREDDVGVLEDQPLWLVRVDSGKTTPVEYVDLRVWARNGGCTANDDLVRTYMNYTGTMIEINGTLWLLRVGANNVAEWVKLLEDDTGWEEGGLSSYWRQSRSYLRAKMRNGLVEIRGRVDRDPTAELNTRADGNIANVWVGSVPKKFAPESGPSPALASSAVGPSAHYYVDSDGGVYITSVAPGTKFTSGFSSTFSGMYFSR